MNPEQLQAKIQECENRLRQLLADYNYVNGKKETYEELLKDLSEQSAQPEVIQ